jgi:hypothetical protein
LRPPNCADNGAGLQLRLDRLKQISVEDRPVCARKSFAAIDDLAEVEAVLGLRSFLPHIGIEEGPASPPAAFLLSGSPTALTMIWRIRFSSAISSSNELSIWLVLAELKAHCQFVDLPIAFLDAGVQ